MKTRTSFVANSSSSSFIAIGIQSKELAERFFTFDEEEWKWIVKDSVKLPSETTVCYSLCDKPIIGWMLSQWDDEGTEIDLKHDFEELVQYSQKFEEVFGIKPKLIGGTYSC
jgi:hypothetical protein